MRQVRLTMTPTEPAAHPFCDLTSGDGPIGEARSLYCSGTDGSRLTSLFAIPADPGDVERELDDRPELVAYDMTTGEDGVCYVNIQAEMTDLVQTFFEIVSLDAITLVLPVVYTDGSASVELVGSDAALQEAVDRLPSSVRLDVESIGEFTDGESTGSVLSDRQREAVLAGLELGYYETPRRATHEDVAERIGCAPSTASEHLNRAEAKLVKATLSRS